MGCVQTRLAALLCLLLLWYETAFDMLGFDDLFCERCWRGEFGGAMRTTRRTFIHFFQAERAGRLFLDNLFTLLVEALAYHAAGVMQLVQTLDEHEHDPCDDQEVDDSADERAEIDAIRRACYGDDQARNACSAASYEHDEWLDDVINERGDDSRERCANDDADSHIHHISAADKLFEFADDLHLPHPCLSCLGATGFGKRCKPTIRA